MLALAVGLALTPTASTRADRAPASFERVIAPEMIDVNHAKLIDNLDQARLTQADTWAEMLATEQLDRVMALEMPDTPAEFHFPAELWVRCLYDTLVAFHRPGADRERLLAALTPLYFGRTAGFMSETLALTTDQAERVIDDQARQFEDLKPYLVARWREMRGASADAPPSAGTPGDGEASEGAGA